MENYLEFETNTIEEAREAAKTQIPEGFKIVKEEILSGGIKIFKGSAASVEEAFTLARKQMPTGAADGNRKVIATPGSLTFQLSAIDEEAARDSALEKAWLEYGPNGKVQTLQLVSQEKKGFLGIGKKAAEYEATIVGWAEVEISIEEPVKVKFTLGEVVKPAQDANISESPDLLVVLIEREPSQGRDQYVNQLIPHIPKDFLAKTLYLAVPYAGGFLQVKNEDFIRNQVDKAARQNGYAPDEERLIWVDSPVLGGIRGMMAKVYRKKVGSGKEESILVKELQAESMVVREQALSKALAMKNREALEAVETAIEAFTGKKGIKYYDVKFGSSRFSSPDEVYAELMRLAGSGKFFEDPSYIQSLIPGIQWRNTDLLKQLSLKFPREFTLYQLLGVQMQLKLLVGSE